MLCISIVCYAVCCLASNYLFLIEQSEFGKIYLKIECWFGRPYNNFIIAIVWIMIGKYFAENIKNRNSGALALKLLASIALLVGEHIFIKERMGTAWNWNTDVYIMLLPASIFLFLLAEQSRMKIQGAENLRKISTIIYCSHWSIQAVLRVGFELLSIRDKWNVLLFLITSVSACIGGVIIMKLEKKWKVFKYAY
ncbi:MAG: hypothetical protein HFH49_00290 [Lachnospiraceae bacterium]|nr:hypothetical protein [Lachnospiraceae bacterium]